MIRVLRRSKGFTLIEVMVSIALLSVVAIYAIQFRIDQVKQDMSERIANQVMSIANIATTYYATNGRWPTPGDNDDDDCSNLMTFVEAQGFIPQNIQFPPDVSLSFGCEDDSNLGRPLQITVSLGTHGQEVRDYLLGYLPNSVAQDSSGLVHYVSPPRKLASAYQFQMVNVEAGGIVRITPPNCERERFMRAMLLPQAVCLAGSATGLGGFYFDDQNIQGGMWQFVLRVARGDNNGTESDFDPMATMCGGVEAQVGAITYCEAQND